jgi:ribose-phosphate pyrophosphokinase
VVVSPDLGNAKTATQFARLLGLPVAAGSKQRLADDRVVIEAIVGDVAGKNVIVLDDEIATGGSIMELLDRSATRAAAGSRSRARTACSPARRSSGCPTTRASTRSSPPTPVPTPADWPRLAVRSVDRLFAEAISRIHAGESVSSLFDGVDPTYAPPQPRLPL